MTELQNETLPDDRGITPVGTGDNGRTTMLKRGFGALALTAFAFLIIWGTWKGDKPVSDSARKLTIRQASGVRTRQGNADGTDHHGVHPGRSGRGRVSGTRARSRPDARKRASRAGIGL